MASLSPPTRTLVDIFGLILVAILNGALLGFSIGWIHKTGLYLMPSIGLPRVLAQLSVPAGCGLAILFCLLRLAFPKIRENKQGDHLARTQVAKGRHTE